MNSSPTNVMIDLETLGDAPGCKLLTLSAETFGLQRNAQFHCAVRIDSQSRLHASADTIDWWQAQPAEARKAAFESAQAISLVSTLSLFTKWLHDYAPEPIIWCKGANFDAPILAAAYKAYDMTPPWEFRNVRCYRTLLALVGPEVPEPKFIGVPHTSRADAHHQATYANLMLEYLGEKLG